MPVLHKTRVKEIASNKPNAATAFNLPDSAATGFRSFNSVYATNDLVPYHATNNTDWESGIGTFTAGTPDTLTRTTILESSNSNAAVDFSSGGDVTVFVEMPSGTANDFELFRQALTPGGRLTLESGVPVSTTDQTAKTNIYYTPYIHNTIVLWDGTKWKPIVFTEYTLALGTLTSGKPYDVFAYLNSGVLALEVLVWTNATTRATAVTLQDGRYCKSGDKTRLLIGTFYTKTATTVEDSEEYRLLSNLYNQVERRLFKDAGSSSHTYSSSTLQQYNAGTGDLSVKFVTSKISKVQVSAAIVLNTSASTTAGRVTCGYDSITSYTDSYSSIDVSGTYSNPMRLGGAPFIRSAQDGYHYIAMLEAIPSASGTATFDFGRLVGVIFQ